MKKLLLSMLALASFTFANAQLDNGCKAKDFTFTALNNSGQVVNLYSWLDSGKYVFLDVSATWCSPCWNYHNTHALKDLFTTHGPGTPSNDVRVVFVEGDGTTDDSKMSGGAGSQGNWLLNSPYPMCNPATALANSFNDDYEIGYFPTIYMICPDRTVKEVGQLTAAQLYAEVSPTPACAPKINVDVTPVTASGKLFSCTGSFSFDLTIKNRGFNNLTNATINLKNGATTLGSQAWTGSLATYDVSGTITVTAPSVPAGVDSLVIEVIAAGDQITTNDKITVYIDNYTTPTASAVPYNENMDAGVKMPTKFGFSDIPSMSMFGFYDGIAGATKLKGVTGSDTKGVFVNFFNRPKGAIGSLIFGNFNTTTSSPYLYLDMDVAYAQYTAGAPENDKLEVLVSTDCGATWTNKWMKSGNDLKTTSPTTSNFIPSAASQWAHHNIDLTSIKNNPNALVALKATSDFGNYAWIDNINIAGSAIPFGFDNIDASSVDVYPNPANDAIYVRGVSGDIRFALVDVLGRTVKTLELKNVTSESMFDITSVERGNYFLKITSEGKTVTKSIVIAD